MNIEKQGKAKPNKLSLAGGAGDARGRRFVSEQDVMEVTKLFERLFHKETNKVLWKWKYLPPWTDEAYSWVASMDGQIAGHFGVIPLRGQIRGEETMFFQFGDIMADPKYRSLDVYRQLNPTKVVDEIRRKWPKSVIYGFTGRQQSILYTWFASVGKSTHVESADDRLIQVRAEDGLSADTEAITVRAWDWDTPELDELWQELQDTVPIGLIRDRPYLNWRYATHPLLKYSLFGVYENDVPVGWLVTTIRKETDEFKDEFRIQDFLLPPEIHLPALKKAASILNAGSLVLWLPANYLDPGIKSRASGGWKVMYHSLEDKISKNFLANRIFYTLGEADEWWW